jgi:hypothetical protein
MSSDIISCSRTKAHIETDCTIELNGQKFTSGGSFLWPNEKTGKLEGLLYATIERNQKSEQLDRNVGVWPLSNWGQKGTVGSWDGSLKIPALFLNEWVNSMGDIRQRVRFEYQGKKFSGIYYKSGSDIVRVKEVKA